MIFVFNHNSEVWDVVVLYTLDSISEVSGSNTGPEHMWEIC